MTRSTDQSEGGERPTQASPAFGFSGPMERATGWFVRNRWNLMLLGPAAAYLAIVGTSLMGPAGLLAAAAVIALIAAAAAQIPADTWLSLYRAEPVAPGQAQGLRLSISSLSDRAGLAQEPALAIVPSLSVGVFSVGSGERVAILMTEGLLRKLKLRELVTLAAHEIGHIRGGHLKVFAVADVMMRVAQLLYYAGVALLVAKVVLWFMGERFLDLLPIVLLVAAPALNSALQLSLPREHDFVADQTAAFLLGTRGVVDGGGDGQGSALDDLRFPVPQRHVPLPSTLRCAAPTGKRQAALMAEPPSVLLPPLEIPDEPMISLLGFGPVEMRPRDRWPGIWF